MSVQLEDVVDCLRVLYPEYDIVFLFDHSQGHARKRNGALNTIQMSRAYGGAQAIIRDTTILDEEAFSVPTYLVFSTSAMFNHLFSSLVIADHFI
jgi:hypothetical protein